MLFAPLSYLVHIYMHACVFIHTYVDIFIFMCTHTNGPHTLTCFYCLAPLQKIFADVSCKKLIVTMLTWGVAVKEQLLL